MVLIPDAVNAEVEIAREKYQDIPAVVDCTWAELEPSLVGLRGRVPAQERLAAHQHRCGATPTAI